MRKILALLLCLCLLTACAYAAPDNELKDAYNVYLNEGSGKHFTLESANIDVSKMEVWCAASAEAQAKAMGITPQRKSEDGRLLYLATAGQLGLTEFFVTDISPLGNVMLGMLGGFFACVTDGRIILQAYSAERSTPDVNNVMDLYNSRLAVSSPLIRSLDGAVWAPDGSMAALTNGYQTLIKAQFKNNPLLIMDVQAGEYYMAITTATKFTEPFFTTPIVACFDETGRYVYCVMYKFGLIEHDTVTGENRVIGTASEYYNTGAWMPYLNRLKDGRLVYSVSLSDKNGIGIYAPALTKYTIAVGDSGKPMTPADLPEYANVTGVSGEYNFSFVARNARIPLRGLKVSPESGYGVAICDGISINNGGMITSLACLGLVNANLGCQGINDYILLMNDGTLRKCSLDELSTIISTEPGSLATIGNAVLSPDGYYALLAARDCMYICNLKTLELVPVDYPEDMSLSDIAYGAPTATYNRGIAWPTGDLLVTTCGVYKLTWDKEYVAANKPAQEETAAAAETAAGSGTFAGFGALFGNRGNKAAEAEETAEAEIAAGIGFTVFGALFGNAGNKGAEATAEAAEAANTWTCPVCGRENTADMKFCPNDATPRPAVSWTCPVCGRVNDPEMKFCPNDATPRP